MRQKPGQQSGKRRDEKAENLDVRTKRGYKTVKTEEGGRIRKAGCQTDRNNCQSETLAIVVLSKALCNFEMKSGIYIFHHIVTTCPNSKRPI